MAQVLATIKCGLLSETKNYYVYAPLEGQPAVGKYHFAKSIFTSPAPKFLDLPLTVPGVVHG